jgi:hypothetical protein
VTAWRWREFLGSERAQSKGQSLRHSPDMGSVRGFRETILEAISGLALHHVGFAVAAIELTTRSYVTRYGYAIRTPVIHDPLQTAFVQFLALPGDHVYLELVSPDGPASRLSSAVRRGGTQPSLLCGR